MRRRRWITRAMTVFSAAMAVALIVIGVRSVWVQDRVHLSVNRWSDGTHYVSRNLWVIVNRGAVVLRYDFDASSPNQTPEMLASATAALEPGARWTRVEVPTSGEGFWWAPWAERWDGSTKVAGGRSVVIGVPVWIPLAVTLWMPLRWLVRRRATARMRLPGWCAVCGYDLRATPARCPECGVAVEVNSSQGG